MTILDAGSWKWISRNKCFITFANDIKCCCFWICKLMCFACFSLKSFLCSNVVSKKSQGLGICIKKYLNGREKDFKGILIGTLSAFTCLSNSCHSKNDEGRCQTCHTWDGKQTYVLVFYQKFVRWKWCLILNSRYFKANNILVFTWL